MTRDKTTFYSTNLRAPEVNFETALLTGLAPDRGLYMPKAIPRLSKEEIKSMKHMGYAQIAALVAKTILRCEIDEETLENIIKKTVGDVSKAAIFNNAAQVWNHTFYWQSMKPQGGGPPTGAAANKIKTDFGSYEKFAAALKNAGLTRFGSGWAWVVYKDGKLEIIKTSNADTPIVHGLKPVLTVDVWEHAYYLDYQNRRADYLDVFIKNLINWNFVNSRIS